MIAADSSQRDTFAAVAAALAGICVNGLVIDTFHWRHFWFLLGLAWWAPAQDGGQPAGEPFPAGRLEAAPRSYLVRAESKS